MSEQVTGVSSLWNKNGVDWTQPSKYRTSYLIRELYQAVYERYYEAYTSTRIRNSLDISTPENKYYDERDEYAVYQICHLLNTMFADDPQYSTFGLFNNRSSGYMATGCFIDDAYSFDFYPSGEGRGEVGRNDVPTAFDYNNFMGGVEFLTLTKFEEYYGDMTFVRDRGVGHRITTDFINKVYLILNHPMKLNLCIPKPIISYSGVFQGKWTSFDLDCFSFGRPYLRTKVSDSNPTSTDNAVSTMENDMPISGFEFFGNQLLTMESGGYQVFSSFNSYFSESYVRPLCLNNNMLNFRGLSNTPARDLSNVSFDFIKHSYVNKNRDDYNALNIHNPFVKNFNRVSDAGLNTVIVGYYSPILGDNEFTFTFVGNDNTITGIPLGFADAGAGESFTSGVGENSMILMNINSENVCKYYTEPTN